MWVYVCKMDFEWPEEPFQRSLSRVNSEKKTRILRYVHKKDAWRSLLAEVLLRSVLRDRLQLREADMVFETNLYGKPSLSGRPEVEFNLTHSGDWVGCVVGNAPVGIDIEQIRPIEGDIAERFFSAGENEALRAQPENKRLEAFFELWTLKESYIKAVGKGLSLPLDSFTVRLGAPVQPVRGTEEGLFCRTYALEEGYKMAVCSTGDTFPEKPVRVDAKRLAAGDMILN